MPESVVLLHGFSGTGRAWDGVAARLRREGYRPLAPDLPGHGTAADAERPITFASCVQHVLQAAPERFVLCGYSLGGRVALHVALAAPRRVSRLVLVSTSAGIEDATERAARREADRALADELGTIPFEDFIERWRTQPLFAGDPPEVDRLGELGMPVTVVAGERDVKFRDLGQRMVALLPGARLTVIAGGHVLPLENPAGLTQVIDQVDD